MRPGGFEPTISADEHQQTHALDRRDRKIIHLQGNILNDKIYIHLVDLAPVIC